MRRNALRTRIPEVTKSLYGNGVKRRKAAPRLCYRTAAHCPVCHGCIFKDATAAAADATDDDDDDEDAKWQRSCQAVSKISLIQSSQAS